MSQDSSGDSPGMAGRAERFIAEYQEAYSAAITEAYSAAETTATLAYQDNFSRVMAEHNGWLKVSADGLIELGKKIVDFDIDERSEKRIGDILKELKEERKRHESWISRSVDPFRSKAMKCSEIIDTARREAIRIEKSQPLTDSGFERYVVAMMTRWPRAEWDQGRGVVTIVAPPAKGNEQTGT